MEAIQTHTVQADAHAAALKKAVKGAKFPSKTAPTINYSEWNKKKVTKIINITTMIQYREKEKLEVRK
ncbi:hypothetical protein [Carnobacterium sp. FSL E2-0243]|uniref:hypothetical protein n=1 Tax=Carnobacterium sp. FSL E2-0243 TaxID=2921365 RepID=UPI0030FB31EF